MYLSSVSLKKVKSFQLFGGVEVRSNLLAVCNSI